MDRHINSAHKIFERQLFYSIYNELSDVTKTTMDSLLSDDDESDNESELEDLSHIKFKHLKQDIPGAKLKNVEFAINKINYLRKLQLPENILSNIAIKLINKYYTRVMAELPSSLLEYKEHIRYATFSIFCYHRSKILIDHLTDLLMKLIHNMKTSAESAINKKVLSEVKRVNGKFDILCKLANISLSNPTGIIQEKIYPEVGQETLSDIVKDINSKGKWYENQVNKKM